MPYLMIKVLTIRSLTTSLDLNQVKKAKTVQGYLVSLNIYHNTDLAYPSQLVLQIFDSTVLWVQYILDKENTCIL